MSFIPLGVFHQFPKQAEFLVPFTKLFLPIATACDQGEQHPQRKEKASSDTGKDEAYEVSEA